MEGEESYKVTPEAPDNEAQGILAKDSVPLLRSTKEKSSAHIPPFPHTQRADPFPTRPLHQLRKSSRARGRGSARSRLSHPAAAVGPRPASPPRSRCGAAVPLPAL